MQSLEMTWSQLDRIATQYDASGILEVWEEKGGGEKLIEKVNSTLFEILTEAAEEAGIDPASADLPFTVAYSIAKLRYHYFALAHLEDLIHHELPRLNPLAAHDLLSVMRGANSRASNFLAQLN